MLDHVSSFIYQSIIFTYIYFLREYSDFIFFKMFKNLSLEEMYRTNDISLRKQCMADLEDKKKKYKTLNQLLYNKTYIGNFDITS